MTLRIRKAVIPDIRPIHQLLKGYADQDLLLPRALSELYDQLRDYFVLTKTEGPGAPGLPPGQEGSPGGPGEGRDAGGTLCGVCGLHICWEDLAEIKSLAVSQAEQSRGFGARLVEACLEEARSLGLKRVFVLTYIPGFFRKLGFRETEKALLPQKVWGDCLKCPKFPDCGETALILNL